MEDQSHEAQSRLYLLRVWIAPGPDGAVGYRGKLQSVLGEGSYCFAGEAELLALLASLFPDTDTVSPSPAPPESPGTQEC